MAAPNEDVDTSTANERDKQKLLDAAREAEGREPGEREPEPEIEIEEERERSVDDDPEGGTGDEPRAPDPKPPREERRGNRFAEAQQSAEEWRARAMALEAQLTTTRTPPAPQRSREELEEEARQLYRQDIGAIQRARTDLQQLTIANKDKWTPEIEQRIFDEDANLRILETEAQDRYLERRRAASRPPPAPPPNPAIQVVFGRYDDVVKDPFGMRSADLYYMKKKREGTKLSEVDLVEESMKYGRAEMRGEAFSPATRERPKPTKEQKARYQGGGSNGTAGPPDPSAKRSVTEREAKLAHKLYAHIPDPQTRLQMYWKNVKMKRA